jgi:hypothetical protein
MSQTDLRITVVRRDCPDGRTCPVAGPGSDGRVYLVAKRVTDPAALAQLAVGDDEIAVWVPGSLLPEVLSGGG